MSTNHIDASDRQVDYGINYYTGSPHDVIGTINECQHSQEPDLNAYVGLANYPRIDNQSFCSEQNHPIIDFSSNAGLYRQELDTNHTSNVNDSLEFGENFNSNVNQGFNQGFNPYESALIGEQNAIRRPLFDPASGENFNSNVNQGFNPYESALLGEQNAIGGPLFYPASSITRDFDIQFPQATHSIGTNNNAVLSPGDHQYRCNICHRSFKRVADRTRHENSVHSIRAGIYLCPIAGCTKSQGGGFSRADKVTKHLWKRHGNLGYTKRS